VKLVLATNHLGLGGSESYLLTVAEQLDRLGHEVQLFSPEVGAGAQVAAERGVALVTEAQLPAECDGVLVQDAAVSLQLADRYPSAPQLFVAHSESFDLQAPPQLGGVVSLVVAMNDRVAARMRSYASEREVVRLRQPIDTERFISRNPLPQVPERVLLLSNTPLADRMAVLESACEAAGLELVRIGGIDGQTADPRSAIAAADIVVGYGRSILEAMACGRAAYVYDWNGGEGWVTADSYPEIEANGIAGRSGRVMVDADSLVEDFGRYSASMGPVNHDLAIANHRANVHAQQLVELFRDLGAPANRPRESLQEMARLVRLEWRARADVHALSRENVGLRDMLKESQEGAAERVVQHGRAVEAHFRNLYEGSISWRLTAPLRALMKALRRGSG
jgi:hypothetical protein